MWSKYNYLFHSKKYGYLLYNSLTNCFAQVDIEMGTRFEKYNKNGGAASSFFEKGEIIQLQKAKILVESDYDEYLQLKMQKHLKRLDKSLLNLTIAPTLHCNFCCDYCFEESRPKVYMTDETEDNIISFIKRHNEVENIYVTWFGGEPLMAFDRIESLTRKIGNLGINYNASIVTNGYLLTQEVIDNFVLLKIKDIHVTIDGPENIHNKRRPHISEDNSFSVIYSNMLKLKPYLKDKKMILSVRVNIDKTNEEYYHLIHHKIQNDFNGIKVKVYPGIVKNMSGACSSIDDSLMDNQSHASFCIQQFVKHGIKSSDFFPIRVNGECIARQLNGYLIDARGDIYKCWTDIGKKSEIIGNVSATETINSTQLIRYLTGADVFDKQECQECFFLPVCGGGCPHLAIKKMKGNNSINLCTIAKGNLEIFLEIYYEIKIKEEVVV